LTLTDFIFLRLGSDELDSQVLDFLAAARTAERQILAMTFSSMPVGEKKMLEVAIEICNNCMPPVMDASDRHKPAVIVLAAGQGYDPAGPEQLEAVAHLEAEKRLLVLRRGVPFGALFTMVNALVLHGGLGVTSEALMAGLPVITSGILLMDQRYWAARMADLGTGSNGIPIEAVLNTADDNENHTVIVDLVQKALDKRGRLRNGNPTWPAKAKEVQQMLARERAGDVDGVVINATEVYKAGVVSAVSVRDAYEQGCCLDFGRQCHCCARTCGCCAYWLLCRQIPSLLMLPMLLICRCMHMCRRVQQVEEDQQSFVMRQSFLTPQIHSPAASSAPYSGSSVELSNSVVGAAVRVSQQQV